ncbi:hypothetical protein BC332_01019 [Capsicum chinense]|nr:hypothetical protein BC332_01019 [Capsicum chinense]
MKLITGWANNITVTVSLCPRKLLRMPKASNDSSVTGDHASIYYSGTQENFRQVRITNVKKVDYSNWAKLVIKYDDDPIEAKPG